MPSLRDNEAWLEDSTPEQAAAAVSSVEAMTPANMSTDEIGTLAKMIVRRDYTAAELAYATEALMYDDDLVKEVGFREEPRLWPGDFERVIGKHREMRRRLEQLLTRHEMNRLIREFPKHLQRSDFGVAGYTVEDKPLFRFKADPETADGEVRPTIEEDSRPGADRTRDTEGATPIRVGEAIERTDLAEDERL